MATTRRLLILDACVLIDFSHIDRRVLAEVCRAVGSIHVARPVFDVVDEIDEVEAANVGLFPIEPDLEDVIEATRERSGALSFQDKLCQLLARRHDWACVSNDKPLRQACTKHGIAVLWGLEMLELASAVSASDLEASAWAIHAENPRCVPRRIVEVFASKLRR